MPVETRLVVEGIPELRRMLRAVGGRELEKELGQVHKGIGEMVITAAGGKATGVGTGAGSTIRPSAAVREVLIRVGGGHRRGRPQQWGRNQIWPGGAAPARPHLIGAALRIQDKIEDSYLAGIEAVIRKAGLE